MSACAITYIQGGSYGILSYFMSFSWGMQDGAVCTHTYSILGQRFNNRPEAYSIFNLM